MRVAAVLPRPRGARGRRLPGAPRAVARGQRRRESLGALLGGGGRRARDGGRGVGRRGAVVRAHRQAPLDARRHGLRRVRPGLRGPRAGGSPRQRAGRGVLAGGPRGLAAARRGRRLDLPRPPRDARHGRGPGQLCAHRGRRRRGRQDGDAVRRRVRRSARHLRTATLRQYGRREARRGAAEPRGIAQDDGGPPQNQQVVSARAHESRRVGRTRHLRDGRTLPRLHHARPARDVLVRRN
mmetsp:Transcript_1479/g.4410  ORF Transcript_1479/g.4410 Transcript_1479/m.4410 type:complete len:239 (+) Transcript_1479:1653-2369(+)